MGDRDELASRFSLIPLGDRAALVEVASTGAALGLAHWARSGHVQADEIVPAATSVLFDGTDLVELARALAHLPDLDAAISDTALVEIPVVYDGEDLARVATLWGCTTAEVISRHTSTEFVSAFCGFAPGFAYLSGLGERWQVPRLAEPRPRIPAGSVALGGQWCGIYPTASPGGWLLLGRTELTLWNPDAAQPALLAPGTRARFLQVG